MTKQSTTAGQTYPASAGSAFDRVRMNDATVHAMLKAGRTLEETIVALVCEKNRFVDRIVELEMIAPRRITLPDGRVVVWRCPDHLVPEMPNTAMSLKNPRNQLETNKPESADKDGKG